MAFIVVVRVFQSICSSRNTNWTNKCMVTFFVEVIFEPVTATSYLTNSVSHLPCLYKHISCVQLTQAAEAAPCLRLMAWVTYGLFVIFRHSSSHLYLPTLMEPKPKQRALKQGNGASQHISYSIKMIETCQRSLKFDPKLASLAGGIDPPDTPR